MNLKKVTQKLSKVRDSIRENGEITAEDEKTLKSLIGDTIGVAQENLPHLPKKITGRVMPSAENDNKPLTKDQKFRLRLMEKTGTGSKSVH